MLPISILSLAMLLTSSTPATTANVAAGDPGLRLLYTAAKTYEPLAWLQGKDRFSSDATIFLIDGNNQRPLIPEFTSTADPEISFDGQRVLFAAKPNASDNWQIWESSLEDGKPRRISQGKEDCVHPLYLPANRIVYARKVDGHFLVESSDILGQKILPLTYIHSNAIPTDVLHDGRILFQSSYPLGTDVIPEVYTVYSDGSGVESYRCDHGVGRHSARQISSGDLVFATARGLARFTSARAQQVGIQSPSGEYAGDIAEASSGEWILSWRLNAASQFQLVRWTPGFPELAKFLSRPGLNLIQPATIQPHAVPNRHPSGLHDWPNANLLCLNAYTSKLQFAADSIRSARFYTQNSDGSPRLLGTAPVERDGSFFVQVPNDQPLQIELLDSGGKILKRESGFFWMRRGEQRVCVGCHAGPETAPENAVPIVLLKSTTPADLTGSAPHSAGDTK